MQNIKQTDFLPHDTLQYPYILMDGKNEGLPTVLQSLREGADLPLCIEYFGDIVMLKRIDNDLKLLYHLFGNISCEAVLSETVRFPIKDVLEFSQKLRNFKEGNVDAQ